MRFESFKNIDEEMSFIRFIHLDQKFVGTQTPLLTKVPTLGLKGSYATPGSFVLQCKSTDYSIPLFSDTKLRKSHIQVVVSDIVTLKISVYRRISRNIPPRQNDSGTKGLLYYTLKARS